MKKNKIRGSNISITRNTTNVTNSQPVNNEKDVDRKFSVIKKFMFFLTISLVFSVSINISLAFRNDITPTEITATQNNTILTSEDCYTKTVVHGSRNTDTDEKQQVIEIHTSLYENTIISDLTYDDNGEYIKTSTETPVKIVDITHLYYPNSSEYDEVYDKYID